MTERRILFLGQKPIGEQCFDILLKNRDREFSVCGAVSNMDTRCWWKSAGIYERATQDGIPFIDNQARHEEAIAKLIAEQRINTLLSVQHAWIIGAPLLQAVGGQAFNLHMAKLPEYKGYNAFSFAIINGDTDYYTTIHWMASKVDAGDIIMERQIPITQEETAGSLYKKAEAASLKCFSEFVDMLKTGVTIPAKPIQGTPQFYGRDSLEKVREITDFTDLTYVDRVVRGCVFPGFQGAYFTANGHKYYILPE